MTVTTVIVIVLALIGLAVVVGFLGLMLAYGGCAIASGIIVLILAVLAALGCAEVVRCCRGAPTQPHVTVSADGD